MLRYDRLECLEVTMPTYMEDIKRRCDDPSEFPTKATYEAFLITTYSSVSCIRYLLKTKNILFMLTRNFNSNLTESLFGTLCMSAGSNNVSDVSAAPSGLQKVLKTGIAASNALSNITRIQETAAVMSQLRSPSRLHPQLHLGQPLNFQHMLCTSFESSRSTFSLQLSATVYVGGCVAKVIHEQMKCESCDALSTKPGTNQPLLTFTRNKDRVGLFYPSDQLLFVLDTSRISAEQAFKETPTLLRSLSTLVDNSVLVTCSSKLLKCMHSNEVHRLKLMKLIALFFFFTSPRKLRVCVTDRHDAFQYITKKSRQESTSNYEELLKDSLHVPCNEYCQLPRTFKSVC